MFVSVAWHVPSDLYELIVSAVGNIPPKNASHIFPSLGISEARLPKLVGVIASDVESNTSDDRSEFTQARTRSIAAKMLSRIVWNCLDLCIPNCLLNPKEIPTVFVKKSHHPTSSGVWTLMSLLSAFVKLHACFVRVLVRNGYSLEF